MSGATRLLLQIYPWLPLGFLLEVAAFHLLFLREKRKTKCHSTPRHRSPHLPESLSGGRRSAP